MNERKHRGNNTFCLWVKVYLFYLISKQKGEESALIKTAIADLQPSFQA